MAKAPQTWMVTPAEEPHTEALGSRLRSLRVDAGLSRRELAALLCMSLSTIVNLEMGRRRTRRSTLCELVRVLAVLCGEDPQSLLAELVGLAGPALAAETKRSEGSIARKRARRTRENLKHDLALIYRIAGRTD